MFSSSHPTARIHASHPRTPCARADQNRPWQPRHLCNRASSSCCNLSSLQQLSSTQPLFRVKNYDLLPCPNSFLDGASWSTQDALTQYHRVGDSKSRHLFLMVLEAARPRSRCRLIRCLVRARFLACRRLATSSLCAHWPQREGDLSSTDPITKVQTASKVNHAPKAPPPNTVASRRRASAQERERTRSVHSVGRHEAEVFGHGHQTGQGGPWASSAPRPAHVPGTFSVSTLYTQL